MRARVRVAGRGPAARLLAALLLALALGGAHAAVVCEDEEIAPYHPFISSLRLLGPETTYSCGPMSYRDCYNQCGCNHLKALEDSSQPDCMFINFWASHPRCGGKALCQQLRTVTRPVIEEGVRCGVAADGSPNEFDFALGLYMDNKGAWIDADASMLINKLSCNQKDTYEACQVQCLMNAKCVAWMHGTDDDWTCSTQLATCPNQPLKGCKRGYCLLFSAFYKLKEWQADDENGHPGNSVGIIPGRTNPAQGQPEPQRARLQNMGDMYAGAVEVAGLTHPVAVGFSLPTHAFDYGTPVNRGSCDAAGNCAHNLPCDLFMQSAAECSALCKAANEKASATLSALLARSDVNRTALQAAGQPTCKFYRWTEKKQNCGTAGLKQGECLLMSSLAGLRPRTARDDSFKRVFGAMDLSELPRMPPPSPAPPPPEPPVVVTLNIGIDGTSKQQFGPAKQTQVVDLLEKNSGGNAKANIVSITDVPAARVAQPRNSAVPKIVIQARLLYPRRQAAQAQRFARVVAAGGTGTAWVKQISPDAAVDGSSVMLQGQKVLPPSPPPPSPPPPSPPPPSPPPPSPPLPSISNSGSSGRAGGRPGGGSVRPVQGRAAMEVEPADQALAAAACTSVFFALPKLLVGGTPHLAAFSDASPQANAAWALAYCQQRSASFGAAGTVRRGVLPAAMAAHAPAVLTFSPADGRTCIGKGCPFVAVVECVPAGAAPCAADERSNVGTGNTGWNNVGHYNAGSNNLGSRNSGSGNIGDLNTASNCIGSYNTEDMLFGYDGNGALVPPASRQAAVEA